MKQSKAIALSAICAAICALLLVLGEFFPSFSLGAAFTAGIVVMIPLSKNAFKSAALTYLAGGALAFFISYFRYEAVLPFIAFFGLQPIVNKLQTAKGWNRYLMLLLKDVWFVGVLVGYFFLFNLTLFEFNADLNRFALPILIAGGALGYIVYDYLTFYFQKYICILVKRLKL